MAALLNFNTKILAHYTYLSSYRKWQASCAIFIFLQKCPQIFHAASVANKFWQPLQKASLLLHFMVIWE